MKYLEHHSIHVYKNGKYYYNTSSDNKDDILLQTKHNYPHLMPYFNDVFYYGSDRFHINGDEYIMIYHTTKVNSEFGV